jgi:hypothetical protein
MGAEFGRLKFDLWQIERIRFGGIVTEPLDILRSELRYQCSFEEIAALLCEFGPLSKVTFHHVVRHDAVTTLYGTPEGAPRPWYDRSPAPDYPGWAAEMRWLTKGALAEHTWESRDWLQALGMLYCDPGTKVDCDLLTDRRVQSQKVVLFARHFPAMWLADRLRGTWG